MGKQVAASKKKKGSETQMEQHRQDKALSVQKK